jgi:hypothetical protein
MDSKPVSQDDVRRRMLAMAGVGEPKQIELVRLAVGKYDKANFLPRYRLEGRVHRRVRLLSASEIRKIREMVLRRPDNMILPPMPGDLPFVLAQASGGDAMQFARGRASVQIIGSGSHDADEGCQP